MIKALKQYLLCETPYREKRAMVMWKKAYQKRLLARAERWKKHGISTSSCLLDNSNN